MGIAPKQDDVTATHIFYRGLADKRDIPRPHPRKHARAVHAQGNVATVRQRLRDACRVVGPTFAANTVRYLPLVSPVLHQYLRAESAPILLGVAYFEQHHSRRGVGNDTITASFYQRGVSCWNGQWNASPGLPK